MAVTTLTDGMTRAAFRTGINDNFAQTFNKATSFINSTISTFQAPQLVAGPTTIGRPLEIVNIGYTGHESGSTRHNAPGGLVKVNWSIALAHNWEWDFVNNRSFTSNASFPSSVIEAGGEGASMHAAPTGSTWYSVPTMGWLVSGNGPRGVAGYTSGYVNHSQNPIFVHYTSTNPSLRAWNPSTATDPLIHLHSLEAKGSGAFLNEYLRLQNNSASGYGAIYFSSSNGSLASRTIKTTDTVVGSVGSVVYDGADQRTAEMRFVTRGTYSSGNAGQSIQFLTSPTNTAGLLARVEITQNGTLKSFVPIRYELGSVTGIPDYSSATSFSPAIGGSTLSSINYVSTSSGGVVFTGFTNVTAAGIPMIIAGLHGHTSPTSPAVIITGRKHNGTTNFGDLAATEIVAQFRNNGTVINEVLANGNWGFGGITTPGALVHIGASTTSRAGLRVVPGAAPSSPANGDIWIDSTAHTAHIRINGVTQTITLS